jgi:putative colanic acid biosynthesis UDP-glucose lipid carrier transferase
LALVGAVLYLLLGEPNAVFASWRGTPLREELLRVWGVWAVSMMVLALGVQLLLPSGFYTREFLGLWLGSGLLVLTVWRILFRNLLAMFRNRGGNRRRVAVAPADAVGFEIGRTIQELPQSGMELVGWFDDRNPKGERPSQMPADLVRGDLEELVAQAREGAIHRIYLAFPLSASERVRMLVQRLSDTTCSVYLVPDFFTFNLLNSRIVSLGRHTAISVFELPYNETDWYLKRSFDLAFTLVFLLFAGIPMLIIAALVKITSPGPAIFKQKRYGIAGQEIEVWKFRSMRTMDNGSVVKQATKGDARVTPLGAILRKTSLDELPQFLNVLAGHMSVVGPRPHAVAHNEEYRRKIHGYMLRHKVKPGITGWAQVNGARGETETLDKMEKRINLDLDYIRNWSLWLDLRICFSTAWQLVFKRSDDVF